MIYTRFIFCLFILTIFTSCQKVSLGEQFTLQIGGVPEITKVEVINDQLIVTGKNLDKMVEAKIEGSTNHVFEIESSEKTKLILNAKSAATFIVGNLFDLILTNAHGAATFPVSFTIQNGQVTGAKINQMGASIGQVLQWNGTTWAPANPASGGQTYLGTYNAATDTPDIVAAGGPAGSFYIVTTAGTQDLGNGNISFVIGDWVSFNGVEWEKIPVGTNTVSSFKGRTGVVVPANDDYTWSMLGKTSGKLTGSKISEIADVDVTGIATGDILQWSGSAWTVVPFSPGTLANDSVVTASIVDAAVTTDKIANGTIVDADVSATAAIAQSKISGLTTALSGKEASITAGTSAQYYRGDKTLQTLNTTAVAEGTNLYFTDARAAAAPIPMGYATQNADVIATDAMSVAIGKVEGKLDVARTTLAAMTSSQWTTVSSPAGVYYTGGNVGIGTNAPMSNLQVSTAGSPRITLGSTASNQYPLFQMMTKHTDTTEHLGTGNPTGSNKGWQFLAAGDSTATPSLFQLSFWDGSSWIRPFNLDNTGNLGIGVIAPATKLDMNGDIRLGGADRTTGVSKGGVIKVPHYNNAYADVALIGMTSKSVENEMFIGTSMSHTGATKITFVTHSNNYQTVNGVVRMTMDQNGIGIGNSDPASALDVSGTIVSRAVSNTVAYINYTQGNNQISSTAATTINICGLKDGGSYNLVLTGIADGSTVTVNAYPTYTNTTSCSGTQMQVDMGTGGNTFISSGNTNIISFIYFSSRGANGTVYGVPATNYTY